MPIIQASDIVLIEPGLLNEDNEVLESVGTELEVVRGRSPVPQIDLKEFDFKPRLVFPWTMGLTDRSTLLTYFN